MVQVPARLAEAGEQGKQRRHDRDDRAEATGLLHGTILLPVLGRPILHATDRAPAGQEFPPPAPIRWLGWAVFPLGALTLALGPEWAILMMGLVFGAGHVGLGLALLWADRRRHRLHLYREVA